MGCTPCGKRYLCTPKKRKHERQYRLRQHGDSAVVPQTADPYRSGNGFLGGVRHHGRHFRRPRRRQRRAGGSQYHGAAVPHQYGRGTDVRCRRFGRGVDPPRTRKGQDGADQRDAGRRRFVAASRGIQPRDLSVRTRRGAAAGQLGTPHAARAGVHVLVRAFSALQCAAQFGHVLRAARRGAQLCDALQCRSGGHQYRARLRFHFPLRLGHVRRGAGHESRLCGRRGDDPRLPEPAAQRHPFLPGEDEPQESPADPPQRGIHVPAGALDLPLRGSHRRDDVHGQLRFHPLPGRGRRGGVQHRLLLLSDHLHGL